jgi:hypothetical protein
MKKSLRIISLLALLALPLRVQAADPTPTPVPTIIASDDAMQTVMQQTWDNAETQFLTQTGLMIMAVFTIYLMFEILYIILDRRRRKRGV